MIRFLVDFALRNRILVLALGVGLLIWGIISFHNLPVEAYPDVADKYVWVITQWPGRAAEEVEQQVTIPIETQMNGLGHLTHLRSTSLAGLSFITAIFDDDSDNLQNRQQVLEKLTLVNLPPGLNPQIGPDFSPAGQIYFYTLQSTDPRYDVMDLKALQDWVVFKHLMSVPTLPRSQSLAVRRASTRCRSIPTNSSPMASPWRRSSKRWPITTSTAAAASLRKGSRRITSELSASCRTPTTLAPPYLPRRTALRCASGTWRS